MTVPGPQDLKALMPDLKSHAHRRHCAVEQIFVDAAEA